MQTLVHRFRLFLLTSRIVLTYSWYFFRTNRLKLRFNNESDRLASLHRKNARAFATFAKGTRGALIKLGQFASARADIMPTEVLAELAILQDQIEPAAADEITQIITEELGRPPEAIFLRFNPVPIAAASLGQVHEVQLSDGTLAVVKVQYSNILELLQRDFGALHKALNRLQPMVPKFYFLPLFQEFRSAVLEEIDYRREAENAIRISSQLATMAHVRTPSILQHLSTARVLTMTYVEGFKITDVEKMAALNLSPTKVMSRVVEIYCQQIFVHAFFQSDPHPGNLFFDRSANGEVVIGLVDFGQAKAVPLEIHRKVLSVVASLLGGNAEGCAKSMIELGIMSEKDELRLVGEIKRLANKLGPTLFMGLLAPDAVGDGSAHVAQMRADFVQFLKSTEGIRIPPDIVLYGRTIMLLNGLCARIAPDLKLLAIMLPYLTKAIKAAASQSTRDLATASPNR